MQNLRMLFKSARSELLKWDSVTIKCYWIIFDLSNEFISIHFQSLCRAWKWYEEVLALPLLSFATPYISAGWKLAALTTRQAQTSCIELFEEQAPNVPSQRRSNLKTSTIRDFDILCLSLTFIMLSWMTGEEEVVSVGSSVPCKALLDTVRLVCLSCGVSDFKLRIQKDRRELRTVFSKYSINNEQSFGTCLTNAWHFVWPCSCPSFATLRHTSPRSLRQAEAAHRANEAKAEASVESSCQFCCIETSKRIQSAFEISPNLILRWKISRFLKCLVFFGNKVGTMHTGQFTHTIERRLSLSLLLAGSSGRRRFQRQALRGTMSQG